MSADDSSANECSSAVIYKRPLFPLHKDYNEIYITSRTPQCVYFKRATQLLQWQLSRYSSLCSKKFMNENRVNHRTGEMGNRSKLLLEPTEGTACDSRVVSSSLSKQQVSLDDQKCKGIILYGSGKCVNKALYVLQDIYEYVKDLYVEAQSRFNHNAVFVPCAACTSKAQQGSPELRGKHGISKDPCTDCEATTNSHLEEVVKKILKVDISTGTVTCRDDVYIYTMEGQPPLSFERFSPLGSCDTTMSQSQQDRMISSIRIAIKVAGT